MGTTPCDHGEVGMINPTIPGGVESGLRNLEKVGILNPTTPGGCSYMFNEYSKNGMFSCFTEIYSCIWYGNRVVL